MISVSRSKRKLPYKVIATTELGDIAYYIPFCDDDRMEGGEGRPVRSITGEDWMPNFDDRMTVFIAGNPGAGKSYLCKQLIKLLPSSYNIMLFTALEENDGNFDELGNPKEENGKKWPLYKITMTPQNLKTISLEEIRKRSKDTIMLFDDVDKIRDSKVAKLIFKIMEDALANGRGHKKHDGNGDIHVLCTSHALNDYQKTKYTLENSNYVALFPGSTTYKQMHTMFDKIGLDRDLCDYMIQLGKRGAIRSIIIHKTVPMYIIFGDQIMLL